MLIKTVQVDDNPVQAPDHPLNNEPDVADAVNVTLLSAVKLDEQEEPQVTPEGKLVTVPDPAPLLVNDSE